MNSGNVCSELFFADGIDEDMKVLSDELGDDLDPVEETIGW